MWTNEVSTQISKRMKQAQVSSSIAEVNTRKHVDQGVGSTEQRRCRRKIDIERMS